MNGTPKELAEKAFEPPTLFPGPDDWSRGYGIMGQPFHTGHVLAMRHNTAPQHGCPGYFSNGTRDVIEAPIHITWPSANRLSQAADLVRKGDSGRERRRWR